LYSGHDSHCRQRSDGNDDRDDAFSERAMNRHRPLEMDHRDSLRVAVIDNNGGRFAWTIAKRKRPPVEQAGVWLSHPHVRSTAGM
jgi:hypothetical protein